MNIFIFIALVFIGFSAGIASGLFGIGGGTLIVPALILLLVMPLQEAQAVSLASLALPIGLFGSVRYYKAGYLRLRNSGLIVLGLLLTAPLGTYINLSIKSKALAVSYGIFLIYIAARFIDPIDIVKTIKNKRIEKKGEEILPDIKVKKERKMIENWILILAIGLTAGIAAGFFGIGGGAIIVPSLVFLCGFDYKKAVATSLAAMVPPVSIFGVYMHYQSGTMNLIYALPIGLGILLGEFFGSKIGINLSSKITSRLYGLFLIATAVYVIIVK